MMKSNAVVVEKNLTRDEDMTLRNRTRIRKDMIFLSRYQITKRQIVLQTYLIAACLCFYLNCVSQLIIILIQAQNLKHEGVFKHIMHVNISLLSTCHFYHIYVILNMSLLNHLQINN